jgi:hypothetical protein
MTYRNNWTEPVSVEKAPDVDVTSANVFITSADRDVVMDPSPFHFKAKLPTPAKNVLSVRVIQAVLPAAADLADQPYVFLDLPEAASLEHSGTGAAYTAMATFTPHYGSGPFVNMDQRTLSPVGCVFKPLKPRLDSITFCLRLPDGILYTPADAAFHGSLSPLHQVSFVLEIVTRSRRNPNPQLLV